MMSMFPEPDVETVELEMKTPETSVVPLPLSRPVPFRVIVPSVLVIFALEMRIPPVLDPAEVG